MYGQRQALLLVVVPKRERKLAINSSNLILAKAPVGRRALPANQVNQGLLTLRFARSFPVPCTRP